MTPGRTALGRPPSESPARLGSPRQYKGPATRPSASRRAAAREAVALLTRQRHALGRRALRRPRPEWARLPPWQALLISFFCCRLCCTSAYRPADEGGAYPGGGGAEAMGASSSSCTGGDQPPPIVGALSVPLRSVSPLLPATS